MKESLDVSVTSWKELFASYKHLFRTLFAMILSRWNPANSYACKYLQDGFGYWTMYRYCEDTAQGSVSLGLMSKNDAVKMVNEMPNTKIMYVDDEKGFIFVN